MNSTGAVCLPGSMGTGSLVSGFIRSSVLMGYRDLVAQLGGNSDRLLEAVNIPAGTLEREDACISLRAVIRLLEASAAAVQRMDFGLLLAQQQDLRILGPIGIIGVNSETVRDALQSMISHLAFYSPAVLCTLDTSTDPGRPRLTYDVAISGEAQKRQLFELAMGLLTRHMQALTDGHFVPVSVMFRHSERMAEAAYYPYLGVRPHFGKAVTALVVRWSDLRRPMRNCDPRLRRVSEDYIRKRTATSPLPLCEQVRRSVRRDLAGGGVSLRTVAAELFMHERTMQRRLLREGAVFEGIVDDVRRERFKELLTEPHNSMAQIADQLGYTEQSSFNRACRRWYGRAPRILKRVFPIA